MRRIHHSNGPVLLEFRVLLCARTAIQPRAIRFNWTLGRSIRSAISVVWRAVENLRSQPKYSLEIRAARAIQFIIIIAHLARAVFLCARACAPRAEQTNGRTHRLTMGANRCIDNNELPNWIRRSHSAHATRASEPRPRCWLAKSRAQNGLRSHPPS